MRFDDVVIPVCAAWSSPFLRWQGPAADVNSLDLAEQVTRRALERSGVQWPVDELVLGWTVPQKEAFYGAPTLAARLGFPGVSGPMVSQACATSVAALHAAAAGGDGTKLVVTTDRTSNGPHIVYPRSRGAGGAPESEHWVLDNFDRDPVTGEGMLATAERVAEEAGFEKAALDELTAIRYAQYDDALADDRAFQREWMVGFGDVEEDFGVRPTKLEALQNLKPVRPDGVVSYGSQTHPADGTAGMIVTSESRAREAGEHGPLAKVLATGFARVEPGTMPKAPVPAAQAALADAGIEIGGVDVIKTHNPFIVNDLWLAQELDVDAAEVNPFGCSLVYGHPQGPTGARGLVELMHALVRRGGGTGLFTGCAAGDTGAAVVIQVS